LRKKERGVDVVITMPTSMKGRPRATERIGTTDRHATGQGFYYNSMFLFNQILFHL
jgi:hypothetical protein